MDDNYICSDTKNSQKAKLYYILCDRTLTKCTSYDRGLSIDILDVSRSAFDRYVKLKSNSNLCFGSKFDQLKVGKNNVLNLILLCLIWCIWRKQNSRTFEDVESSDNQLLASFVGTFFDWSQVCRFTSLLYIAVCVLVFFFFGNLWLLYVFCIK